jgi:hypothetical protein
MHRGIDEKLFSSSVLLLQQHTRTAGLLKKKCWWLYFRIFAVFVVVV